MAAKASSFSAAPEQVLVHGERVLARHLQLVYVVVPDFHKVPVRYFAIPVDIDLVEYEVNHFRGNEAGVRSERLQANLARDVS